MGRQPGEVNRPTGVTSALDDPPANAHIVIAVSDNSDLFAATMAVAGFTPPQLPDGRPSPEALSAADRTTRFWTSPHVGALRPGSAAHQHEVCRMFRETFNPYRPSVIAWPTLT